MFKCEQQKKSKQMIVYSNVRIRNINKLERSNVRTKQMQMSKTSNLARRQKNKHIRYEFLDTRRTAYNLIQKAGTEFPNKRLSYLYDLI